MLPDYPGIILGDPYQTNLFGQGIILNTKGSDSVGVEPALIDFLHYVPDSTERQISEEKDRRLRRLHEIIETIRESSEMEAAYMKAETREREIIADAKAEGREEGLREGMREAVASLMTTLKLTEEQAMEALKIPESERKEYARLMAEDKKITKI